MGFWISDMGKPMVEPQAWTGNGHWNRWFRAALAEAFCERQAGKTHNQAVQKYSYRDGVYVWQHTERRVKRETVGVRERAFSICHQ